MFPAKLLLTPMKHMVVPPPMSAHTIELPSTALIVSFGPVPRCNDMAVLLSNGCLAIYKSCTENGIKQEFKPPGKPPALSGTYRYCNDALNIFFKSLFSIPTLLFCSDPDEFRRQLGVGNSKHFCFSSLSFETLVASATL